MYYGNPSASDVSDGNKTFEFFDDFVGQMLDTTKWNSFNLGNSGSVYANGGYLVIEGGDHYNRGIKSKIIVPSNGKEIRGKYWIETSGDYKNYDGDPVLSFFSVDTSVGDLRGQSYLITDNDEYVKDGICMYVFGGSNHLDWPECRFSENYDARGK
jgi:hypothetical protein